MSAQWLSADTLVASAVALSRTVVGDNESLVASLQEPPNPGRRENHPVSYSATPQSPTTVR